MSAATSSLCPPDSRPRQPRVREKGTHVLLIEGSPLLLSYLRELLSRDHKLVTACGALAQALEARPQAPRPGVIVLDADMLGQETVEALEQLRTIYSGVPVIVLSCSADPQGIVRIMRAGASDYILKPYAAADLRAAIEASIEVLSHPAAGIPYSEVAVSEDASFVCASRAMADIRSQCMTFARVDLPVLILGESGTGKEILAQFIHRISPRAHRTFLKVNCAAMPADLLESELFGYEQGAFTGAVRSKPGKFEICNHGTILLDEIGEMPAPLQAKLLQVLQDGSFARLGSRATVQTDVRVIAATNIDMKAAIAERRFREDLYYRLNGFTVHLPPLRQRKEEIPHLIRHFVQKLSPKYARNPVVISERLVAACVQHPWFGNLRELESCIKRFLIFGDENAMISELSSGGVHQAPEAMTDGTSADLKKMVRALKGEAEKKVIQEALERNHWFRKSVASELNISYKALLYKIRQYGLSPDREQSA